MSYGMSSINRRKFVTTTAAAATFTGLNLLKAQDKSGTSRPVLGIDGHRYEAYHDWLTPPEGIAWGDTHGVAQDSNGNIYIGHTVGGASVKKDSIVVFDQEGKFKTSWGSELAGGAHGLDLRKEGSEEFIYHCDVKRKEFSKTTLDGKVIWKNGYPKEAPPYGQEKPINWNCTNVAFHPDGDFYVADGYGTGYILRYDKDGKFKSVIGKPGNKDGEFANTHGIWVDTRQSPAKLVVADRGNRRIQIFSLDGVHERTIVTPGVVRLPCHFNIQGDFMLCPDLDSVVHILDKDYKVVTSLGDGRTDPKAPNYPLRGATRDKFIPGKFITPHDGMYLANGDILITEWVPIGRVTLLKKLA